MAEIIEIQSLDDPRLAWFASLTDAQLRNRLDPTQGVVIVESPKVITTALDSGLEPLAILTEHRHIDGDAAPILARCPGVPVFCGSRQLLGALTGYTLTRGVLCAMRRPAPKDFRQVLDGARRIVVMDDVTDTTNVGAIFRTAAALGIDAVLLTPTTCDPLNRRAVRVSMGGVFRVSWGVLPVGNPAEILREHGIATAAMALTADSIDIDDPALQAEPRLAIILGTEGGGLPKATIAASTYTVCIPMRNGVDSLNVSNAAAIAIYQLTR